MPGKGDVAGPGRDKAVRHTWLDGLHLHSPTNFVLDIWLDFNPSSIGPQLMSNMAPNLLWPISFQHHSFLP